MKQRGLTLVELLVAVTVGMLVMLLAAGLLAAANAAYIAQLEAAAVDDGGRYALEIITRAARQAAYVNWERAEAGLDTRGAAARVGGLDARTLARATDGIDAPLAGAVNGSDVLAVRFAGTGAAPGGDGSVTSCAGFGVSAAEDGWSIFYVGRNGAGEAELRCKYRGDAGWGADALIGGVDSFQVLYGLDTDTPADGVANEYVSASVLDERDAALVLAGADAPARERDFRRRTHWKRIVGIRVALLIHGSRPVPLERAPMVFDLFGRAYSDGAGRADTGVRVLEAQMSDDLRRRERKLFNVTVLLRNPALEGQP
ncbi:MAG: PilW family protein [Pseudomonadota bacterium]|nr:PilW family protein [Pseudomonadota bacterium]